MSSDSIEILGVGNAIVDCVALIDDDQLAAMGLVPGSMTLIDEAQVARFQSALRPKDHISGGSVANSVFCCSKMGVRCKFIGKVANDALGDQFAADLADASVAYETQRLKSGMPTAQSYVFVTPDAQRTFCTYLGATTQLTLQDYDGQAVREAQVALIEGYLWDSQLSLGLVDQLANEARRHNTLIAISLSDPMLVDRHRPQLQQFVRSHADIVVANESEAQSLFETSALSDSLEAIGSLVDLCVITRGAQGSVAAANGECFSCDAIEVNAVVDTTGAGDAYAGGFLYAMTRGEPVPDCMHVGSQAAARTVTVVGARASHRHAASGSA